MWLDDLRPAFGQEIIFFEEELAKMEQSSADTSVSSGQMYPVRESSSSPHAGGDADFSIEKASVFGRGMCVEDGSGDIRYRNDVIPPVPVVGYSSFYYPISPTSVFGERMGSSGYLDLT